MPRSRRLTPPGTLQHVITRFVDREFRLLGAAERAWYLASLEQALAHTDWRLVTYALMSSHTHLGLVAGADRPDAFMRRLNTRLAVWLNLREGRLGPVVAGRFTSITIAAERAGYLLAYVHNNPGRAGRPERRDDPLWTSHGAYAGSHPAPAFLDVELGLSIAGFDGTPDGRAAFDEFVRGRAGDPRDPDLSGHGLAARHARERRALGAPAEPATAIVGRDGRLVPQTWLRSETPVRPRWPGPLAGVLELASRAVGVLPERLTMRDRSPDVVRARRLVLLTATGPLGRTQSETAAALGISQPAASQLLAHRDPQLVAVAHVIALEIRTAGRRPR